MIRVLLPRTATDPQGTAFQATLADVLRVPVGDVLVVVESRTTISIEGCEQADAERAAFMWARDHLPELEFAMFCGDVRVDARSLS